MNQELRPGFIRKFKGFENPERIALPSGIVTDQLALTLKMYEMITQNEVRGNPVEDAKRFLRYQIGRGNIAPLSGAGFAILSQGVLNLGIWDEDVPIVLKNRLWEFDPERELDSTIIERDIREIGTFCAWEQGIANHERLAWLKYLGSAQTEKDQIDYFGNFIEGELR